MNVWEEDDQLVIEAELPGVQMDALEISVKGEEVAVRGRMDAGGPAEAAWHRRERSTGEFERKLTLPVAVAEKKVEATLKDGVLTIRLPKQEEVSPRKVEVKLLK
jgi:HSP20 family protein